MSEVRILTNDDLNQYITLISNDSHTYSWDKLYFQHVSPNYLKHILSKEEEYCNIFGNFKNEKLVAGVTLRQLKQVGTQHKSNVRKSLLKDKKTRLLCKI